MLIKRKKGKYYTIQVINKLNSDYFRLVKSYKNEYEPISILNDINYDNYWIYKSSNNQREVCKEDVLNMKYSSFIFFKKDLYDKDYIDYWIGIIIELGGIQHLIKPFPPYDPNKIIIKK